MFVAMAEALRPVMNVMELAIRTISMVNPSPTFPTTQPNLKYMIRPKMVRMLGVYTPRKVPNFTGCLIEDVAITIGYLTKIKA